MENLLAPARSSGTLSAQIKNALRQTQTFQMKPQLHIFAGHFASREDACLYTEAQWEPEPGDNVSDQEYAAWEDRNPTWALRDDLGDGDPLPLLQSICLNTGWSVIDVAEQVVVDLTKTSTESWDSFRRWRDKALRQIAANDERTE